MADILFKTENWVFSYRVAGICVKDGCVLLQRFAGDMGYALPGGHVSLGETNAETLTREFREETGGEISVGDLKWVGEIFFPWGKKPCHQICLYYMVEFREGTVPMTGTFYGTEHMENGEFRLEFRWVPLEELAALEVYPAQAPELLQKLSEGVQHFIDKE